MKKNGFLTFIFACIPGAGQMYYGYMQRGLSIAMILILCVMAATVVEPLLFLCLVIWMYSFFDTYDLIRHMAAGEPKEDSLLVLGNYEEIKKLIPQHNRLIGWGLVCFGVWACTPKRSTAMTSCRRIRMNNYAFPSWGKAALRTLLVCLLPQGRGGICSARR